MGRRVVTTSLRGKRVLVTGAAGSVGSALIGALLDSGSIVCAFDNNEDGLFRLDQRFGNAKDQLRLFVGDVRDSGRLFRAFEGVDVIFHCAALKHVYLTEFNPFEAMQTNIVGVNNVIDAAIERNVKKVVFTSSDKAVNPSSTMGASKLLGERLVTSANHFAGSHKTRFSSVRFGNILDTNGSVLQVFRKQISEGEPLTITHEEMTRFFLSMDDAVRLCMHTSENMIGGEIFVASMGSCSIMSIARAHSTDNNLVYTITGCKPGEKLYEELVTEAEARRTFFSDGYYVILPETIGMLTGVDRALYDEKYSKLSCLNKPLRSDEITLADSDVFEMLENL
jgi:UDP-N-acetylglucosamine 4,6-dehydratase/5-epimerase